MVKKNTKYQTYTLPGSISAFSNLIPGGVYLTKLSLMFLFISKSTFFIFSQSYDSSALAYVFEGVKKPKLNATPQNPEVFFYLDADSPPVLDKWNFMSGFFAYASEREFWMELVASALAIWNDVEGGFIKLRLAEEPLFSKNPQDLKHVISFSNKLPARVGAQSFPSIAFGGSEITDCDIQLSSESDSVANISYYLVHEIGHCLGLGHDHLDKTSIMSYARTTPGNNLSVGDKAALSLLYPAQSTMPQKSNNFAPCGHLGFVANRDAQKKQTKINFLILLTTPGVLTLFHFFKKSKKRLIRSAFAPKSSLPSRLLDLM